MQLVRKRTDIKSQPSELMQHYTHAIWSQLYIINYNVSVVKFSLQLDTLKTQETVQTSYFTKDNLKHARV